MTCNAGKPPSTVPKENFWRSSDDLLESLVWFRSFSVSKSPFSRTITIDILTLFNRLSTMDKIISGLGEPVANSQEYEYEKNHDVSVHALIKEPLPINMFMTAAGSKIVVDESKIRREKAKLEQLMKSTQTIKKVVPRSSQEECSPVTTPVPKSPALETPKTSGIHFTALRKPQMSNANSSEQPIICVPPFPAKRKPFQTVQGAGDAASRSTCNKRQRLVDYMYQSPTPKIPRGASGAIELALAIQNGSISGGDVNRAMPKKRLTNWTSPRRVTAPAQSSLLPPNPGYKNPVQSSHVPINVKVPEVVDEFDDDDDVDWWSSVPNVQVVTGVASNDDDKLVTGEVRSATIGEKSRYFTEQ